MRAFFLVSLILLAAAPAKAAIIVLRDDMSRACYLQTLAEPTDEAFPFILLTGRGTSAQWHTGSRTNKSDILRELAPKRCYVEINPADARRLGIASNAAVSVWSRRGSIFANAFITPTVQAGQLFMPMHYAETNVLTHAEFDPHSRQPNYKYCAVNVRA